MLRFFHFTIQFGISVEGIAVSEHCPPLESSQSQHFPGQKICLISYFQRSQVLLVFLSFTFNLLLSEAPHQLPSGGNILCLFTWYRHTESSTHLAREAIVKNICSWNLHALTPSSQSSNICDLSNSECGDIFFSKKKKSYLYKFMRKQNQILVDSPLNLHRTNSRHT